MGPSFGGREARTLDFDVETRPLAWYGGDFVTKQPTAIAWKWLDASKGSAPMVAVIGSSDRSSKVLEEEELMLEMFRLHYDCADAVTGHFIRGFDLPVLNGAMLRLGLEPLAEKWTYDTKGDFMKAQGLSKSQENLGAMFDLKHPKVPMNTALWAEANMLMPEGIEATKKRVVGDVKQHIELLFDMRKRGVLGPGKLWTPGAGNTSRYSP